MNATPILANFQLREVFTFFFITLGPLRLIAPFAMMTAGRPPAECRSIAGRASGVATLTVLVASFLGSYFLVKWRVSVGDLAIAGGILFFLVALQLVLDPYTKGNRPPEPAHEPPTPTDLQRKLVSTIVTPWGITAVIFFLTLQPDQTWLIVGILVGVMALDLLAMLYARQVLRVLAFPLQIIGTVLSVLQVALSVEMIVVGIKFVAIQRFGAHFPMIH